MGTQDERLPWVEQIHSKNLSACYAIPWVQMSNKLKNKVNADNTFGTLMKNISTFKDRLIFIIKMLVFEEIEQWLKYEVFPTPYSIFLVDCCESSLLLFVRRHWQEIHEILSSIKYSSILSFPCGETTQNLSYLPSILLLGTNKNSRSSTACLVWISFRKMHTMHRFARGTRNGIFRPTEPQTKGAYPETHSRFSCPATNVGPAGQTARAGRIAPAFECPVRVRDEGVWCAPQTKNLPSTKVGRLLREWSIKNWTPFDSTRPDPAHSI